MSEKRIPTRREYRTAAFCLLFAYDFYRDTDVKDFLAMYEFEKLDSEMNDEYKILSYLSDKKVMNTVAEAADRLEQIDAEIEENAVKWKVSRMSVSTRSILRLAAYELSFTDTPPKVVINEAVDIIKLYDEENASAFVNGILHKLAKNKNLLQSSEAADKSEKTDKIEENEQ